MGSSMYRWADTEILDMGEPPCQRRDAADSRYSSGEYNAVVR